MPVVRCTHSDLILVNEEVGREKKKMVRGSNQPTIIKRALKSDRNINRIVSVLKRDITDRNKVQSIEEILSL